MRQDLMAVVIIDAPDEKKRLDAWEEHTGRSAALKRM